MQLKKSPRDADYSAVPRFENGPYGVEPTGQHDDSGRPEGYVARPGRQPQFAAQGQGGETTDETRAPARSQSVIDRHSSFDGHFETEHDLRVEGTISGEIVCRGVFTVEREATARARIQAHDAMILGRVEGDVVCTGKLSLAATSHVTGTLKAALLVVEEGATVSGTVDTTQATAKTRPAPAAAPAAENGNAENPAPAREPATVTRARRDLPSFAIVSTEERAASDRN